VDDPEAILTVREHPTAERRTIARERWRFAREVDGRPVADDSYVWLAGGFQPGLMYEVVYRTRVCPVVGTGLLAVRDCTSFLRYGSAEAGNPCAGQVDYAYGFGISQCGRFLRQYLYDGLNLDEAGRQVFDGLIPHVAGARRGEFNHRFAQPSAQHALGFGHLFPFASDDQTDQVTHLTDGLLRRQRALGGVPKIFTTNTSSEYWRIDCSLIHTDPAGTVDLEPPPEERIYMIAGHRHGPGALPLSGVDAPLPNGARTADPQTVVDGSPVIRAFLINLDRWVSQGVGPPASAFPRLADGSAVPRERVLDRVAGIPGVTPLDRALLPTLSRIDLGADASRGVGAFPAATGAPYPSYVSDVDADGNEVAGIRTPEVSVPVGTHTGWVTRHRATGGAGQLVDMLGLTSPLAATAAERARRDDPRPSIEERYRGREDYAARARAAAEQLAAERYVVAEDVEVLVAIALERYDAFARQPVGAGV
jgi:hypothetical protein